MICICSKCLNLNNTVVSSYKSEIFSHWTFPYYYLYIIFEHIFSLVISYDVILLQNNTSLDGQFKGNKTRSLKVLPQNRSKDICILHVKWSWENQNCSSSLPLTDTLFFFRIPWSISDFRRLKNVWDFWWRTKYKTDGRAVRAVRILSRWGSEIFFSI